ERRPDPAIAHHRRAPAPAGRRPHRTTSPPPPGQPGNDSARYRIAARTPPQERRAAGSAADPGDPASARTSDAGPRTATPSPTRRPRHGPPGSREPFQPRAPAERISRYPAHHALPALGSGLPARQR